MTAGTDHPPAPLLSVVVPCYNEVDGIGETHRRLTGVLSGLADCLYEIVYVDDGSRDATAEVLRALQVDDSRVRVVLLSRNFGHQIAVTAGLAEAVGDAVVIIDADLQDPPELVPEMLARWREGYEVVYGVRTDREGETRFKLWTARAFYRLIRRMSDTEIPLDSGDFRLIDRRVVTAILAMPERDRFLRGMVSWVGFRQIGVFYRRAPRFAGTSKYPLVKMARFALDGIVSFSVKPLRLATYAGFIALALALGTIVYTLVARPAGTSTTAWIPLSVALFFLGGVQLIALGLLGEYVGRLYGEVKRRPLYFVRERLGFADAAAAPMLERREFRTRPDRRVQRDRRRSARTSRGSGARRSIRQA